MLCRANALNVMTDLPKVVQTAGKWVDLEEGVYRWCACGLSKAQPFCDDAHVGTKMKPVTFIQEKAGQVILCMCKHTRTPPFCDGSHARFIKDDNYDEYL